MINYTYNNIMLAFLIIFVEKTWSWAVQRAIKESNTMSIAKYCVTGQVKNTMHYNYN